MPYKEFVPRDTLEEALSKLWGAAQEFIPTTRLEEIICMIAAAQPTGGGGVPDIGESDVGKVLTAGEDGAVWAAGGGAGSGVLSVYLHMSVDNPDVYTSDKTWKEIHDAASSGIPVFFYSSDGSDEEFGGTMIWPVRMVSYGLDDSITPPIMVYSVDYTDGSVSVSLVTEDENGYPTTPIDVG